MCPEGGRSVKVNYISMMMDMAEDFSERDPGELLAECIGDVLYDDLDHNVVTDIENNVISHVSTLSISIMMTPAMCTMAYALTRDAYSQCAACASTMHSFDQPIPSIRY
jgi:hypothetical protein